MGRRLHYFLAGMGSVFTLYPQAPFAQPMAGTDSERLAKDWEAVGSDMHKALSAYEQAAQETSAAKTPDA